MMNKTEFKKVEDALNEKGIKCEIRTVTKNGVDLQAMCIGNGSVRPTVYFEDYDTPEEMVAAIEKFDTNNQTRESLREQIKGIENYENAKDRVVRVVMNMKNQEKCPMIPLAGDVGWIFRIDFNEGTAMITHEILKAWGVDLDTLFADSKVWGSHIQSMDEVVAQMTGCELSEDMPKSPLYVVTNERKCFGFSNVFCTSAQSELEEIVGNEFYIIPSSIHEAIVCPIDVMEPDNLKQMIREVNSTKVSPSDFLSDILYVYRNGKITEYVD